MNKLYYGDCLEILQQSIEDESIDLIYIDPPFNSKRDYNVLFEAVDMTDTKAQKQAFADTWSNVVYFDEMNRIMDLDLDLYRFLKALDDIRVSRGVVSYLTIMAHRIYYMHKKLKDTGSFYLHCDPNMSHYLKIVMDLIFGRKNFRNEIVWCYAGGGIPTNDFPRKHDVVLRYTKTSNYFYKPFYRQYTPGTIQRGRTKVKGKYAEIGLRKEGLPVNDWWIDVPKITSPTDKEKIGFPTQKPEALLERIIESSSRKKDVVADFFCGCGTTIAVAQKLGRQWIGVDISHLAVRLVYDRLLKPFQGKRKTLEKIKSVIEINGFPKDIASARDLAQSTDKSRMQFQDWVIEIMMNGVSNPNRPEGGYDGYITFHSTKEGKEVILIEVKSGKVGVKNIREFAEVADKHKASIGAFVCFADEITEPMREWAKKCGYYKPGVWGNKYDKIQIITVEELLGGKSVNFPELFNDTFKTATNIPMSSEDNQNSLFE